MIRLPALGLDVQVLPVTKVQFEQYLAQPDGLGDAWYDAVLALAPRVACFRFGEDDRERLFLTGILPAEAREYLRWLGPDYDLPTVEQWRAIHRALDELPAAVPPSSPQGSPWQARRHVGIFDALLRQLAPRNMQQLSLMEGGLVEWVRDGAIHVGLGCPRPDFLSHLYNPLIDTIRPIRPNQRLPFFGFRAVRKIQR